MQISSERLKLLNYLEAMINRTRAEKYESALPMGCYVEEIVDNGGILERVYKCPDGKRHYIPESLLFSSDVD